MRALAAAIVFLIAFAGNAAAYGARSIGEDSRGVSLPYWSYNARTAADADTLAMQSCLRQRLNNCRITFRFNQSCVVSYIGAGREFYLSQPTLEGARVNAAAACSNASANCRPGVSMCDTGVANPNEPGYIGNRPNNAPAATPNPVTTYTPRPTAAPTFSSDPSSALLAMAAENQGILALAALGLFLTTLYASRTKRPPITAFGPGTAPTGETRLQANIQHAQNRSGYWLNFDLRFSQDTINLIKARRLHDYVVVKGYTVPPITKAGVYAFFYGSMALAYTIPFVFLASIILVFGRYDLGGYLFVACFIAWGFFRYKADTIFSKREEKAFTIRDFMKRPTIQLFADDAFTAKVMDTEIREKLVALRAMLDVSVQIPASETIRL
jgi:hypothetical protein